MSKDSVDGITLLLAMMAGLFFGWLFTCEYFHEEATKHHAAQYDRFTGQWQWIEKGEGK